MNCNINLMPLVPLVMATALSACGLLVADSDGLVRYSNDDQAQVAHEVGIMLNDGCEDRKTGEWRECVTPGMIEDYYTLRQIWRVRR